MKIKTNLSKVLILFLLVLIVAPQEAFAGLEFVGFAEGSGNTANYVVPFSTANVKPGDLIIVSMGMGTTTDSVMTLPTAGYTKVADLLGVDTNDVALAVGWKIMGTTPDSSVTCLGSGSGSLAAVCEVYVIRGADQTTPLDVTTVTAFGNNNSASSPNPGSITPITTGAFVVIVGTGVDAGPFTAATTPSGYSNQTDITADPGTATQIAVAMKQWISGAEDAAAWGFTPTANFDSWGAATLAIRPAAPTRKMRLFKGYKIKLIHEKLIIRKK